MPKPYDIHPDFAKLPSFTLYFNRFAVAAFNLMLRLQRRSHRFGADMEVRSITFRSEDHSDVPALLIRPRQLPSPAPALIYYHGGAFAMSYGAVHLINAERYAREAACCVIFVDYRLGPRHPFPQGFNDCFAALRWAHEKADELGIDPQRIAVGGDSAGGAMAAGVAQRARDETLALRAQLLIYPVVDSDCKTPSATQFTDVPVWNSASNRGMWRMYLRGSHKGAAQGAPRYASPTHGDLHALPAAYVETAEFDPLRDEGMAYADALESKGCTVTRNATRGTVHGFDGFKSNEVVEQALQQRIQFLQQVFRP